MTFRELAEAISKMDPEKIDKPARVMVMVDDFEHWGVVGSIFQYDHDDPDSEENALGCLGDIPDDVDELDDPILVAGGGS